MTKGPSQPIPIPVRHWVDSAVGWLMLGSPSEALSELQRVPIEFEGYLEMLNVKWDIYSELKDWDKAFDIAVRSVIGFSDVVSGWIHRSYAARRRSGGSLREARDLLIPAAGLFPRESVVTYNLACYAAQLGATEEAWGWFVRALAVGSESELKELALADDDLRSIWSKILSTD